MSSKRKFNREMEKVLIEHERNVEFLSQHPQFIESNFLKPAYPPNHSQCSETAGTSIVPQCFETAAPSDHENVYITENFETAASSSGNLYVEPPEIEKLD